MHKKIVINERIRYRKIDICFFEKWGFVSLDNFIEHLEEKFQLVGDLEWPQEFQGSSEVGTANVW